MAAMVCSPSGRWNTHRAVANPTAPTTTVATANAATPLPASPVIGWRVNVSSSAAGIAT